MAMQYQNWPSGVSMAGGYPYNTPQPYGAPQQVMNQFAWVQGEAAAKAYAVAPGNTVILMDTENPVMYMKSTDMSGRPQEMQKRFLVTVEDYETLQNQNQNVVNPVEYVTKSDLEAFMKRLEEKFVIRREKK